MNRFLNTRVSLQFLVFTVIALGSMACSKQGGPAAASELKRPLTRWELMEIDVLDGMNALRENPASIVAPLEVLLTRYNGFILKNESGATVRTNEGPDAVTEAIEAAKGALAMGPLQRSPLLDKAARDHQVDQEKTGQTGHSGSDNSTPWDRIKRYAKWNGAGENLSYGSYGGETGFHTVYGLFVDDGVPDRGHRKNLLYSAYKYVGIACGPHPVYKYMCAIDYGVDVIAP